MTTQLTQSALDGQHDEHQAAGTTGSRMAPSTKYWAAVARMISVSHSSGRSSTRTSVGIRDHRKQQGLDVRHR